MVVINSKVHCMTNLAKAIAKGASVLLGRWGFAIEAGIKYNDDVQQEKIWKTIIDNIQNGNNLSEKTIEAIRDLKIQNNVFQKQMQDMYILISMMIIKDNTLQNCMLNLNESGTNYEKISTDLLSYLDKNQPDLFSEKLISRDEMEVLLRQGLRKSNYTMLELWDDIIDTKYPRSEFPFDLQSTSNRGIIIFNDHLWHQELDLIEVVLEVLTKRNPLVDEFKIVWIYFIKTYK